MYYDFDQVLSRIGSDSLKWHRYGSQVLPMWVADMDFTSPRPVIQALQERVAHGIYGYPKDASALREAIVARLIQRYKWEVRPDELVFVPGVVTGFHLACHALVPDSDAVLVQTPVYHPILHAAKTTGKLHQEMELARLSDGSYGIDWEAFEAAITDQTRLFILCNPHNPVGKVFRQEELEILAEICLRHGLTICSDEIHCDLLFKGSEHIPLASLAPEIACHTITLMAPSKTYNLAGLKCSFAIIPNPELRHKFQRASKGLVGWVNILGLTAALAAYREGQEWYDQLMVYLEENRDYLCDFVQAELPGITAAKPEGTYLAWLDCREAGFNQEPAHNAHQFFLDKARVALNDGLDFGAGGAGFVRFNFGCPRALLGKALERMKTAWESNLPVEQT